MTTTLDTEIAASPAVACGDLTAKRNGARQESVDPFFE